MHVQMFQAFFRCPSQSARDWARGHRLMDPSSDEYLTALKRQSWLLSHLAHARLCIASVHTFLDHLKEATGVETAFRRSEPALMQRLDCLAVFV